MTVTETAVSVKKKKAKKASEPKQLRMMNNLGDVMRSTPGLEKMLAEAERYAAKKAKAQKKNSNNKTQETVNRNGKTNN